MKWDAVLRFHYCIDPKALSETEYWELVAEYNYAKDLEEERMKKNLLEVAGNIMEAIGKGRS